MKKNFTKTILFYCVALILIDFMGLTITIVTFPKLMLDNNGILSSFQTYNHKFLLMALLMAMYPMGQFFGASILGKLSDHWGRKNVLLVALSGTFFGFMLTALSITFGYINLLFISRLISGLFAGNVSIAQACIADISTPETKGKYLTFAQSAMGSAWIFGPILGAYLSVPTLFMHFNIATPYWFFCSLFFLFMLFTLFFFKDTLKEHNHVRISLLQGIQQIIKGFATKTLRLSLFIWFLFVCGWWLFEAFMPAYLFQQLNFSTLGIGHLLTFNGALFVLSQFLIVSHVMKFAKPTTLVKLTGCLASIAMISLALVSNTFNVYIVMTVFALSMAFTLPGFITSISNLETHNAQGQIMGIINSIQSFATILVILLGGIINYLHPSITVWGGGAIAFIAWFLYVIYL